MKFAAVFAVLAAVATADFRAQTAGQDICCAANQDRVAKGLPPLKWFPNLDWMAMQHSDWMAKTQTMDHDEVPNTATYNLGSRLKAIGFKFATAGENLAKGYTDLYATQLGWMNSTEHRDNIMNPGYTVCGGAVSNPGAFYTANFAAPLDINDATKYYNLNCRQGVSTGAVNPHTPTAVVPSVPIPLPQLPQRPAQPAPLAPPPRPAPTSVAPAHTSAAPAPTSAAPAPKPTIAPLPVPTPPPVPQPVPQPAPGKCRRMPKGSIAAGKCRPCKKCTKGQSPFRR